jgi:anhydro-N-acetylmuramic acid kinase
MNLLQRVRKLKRRRILVLSAAGVNSGIGCVFFEAYGDEWSSIAQTFWPYPQAIRELMSGCSEGDDSALRLSSQACLQQKISTHLIEVARTTVAKATGKQSRVDLVVVHRFALWQGTASGEQGGAGETISLGDPQGLADALGVPVLSDITRQQHSESLPPLMPLAPGMTLVASNESEPVAYINVGINSRIVVVDGPKKLVFCDTINAPGTLLINHLVQQNESSLQFDRDGNLTAQGTVDNSCLEQLFAKLEQLSTAEGSATVAQAEQIFKETALDTLSIPDRLATLTATVARLIYRSCRESCGTTLYPHKVWLSGGGAHNSALSNFLRIHFDPSPVDTVEHFGIQAELFHPLALGLTIQLALQDQLSSVTYTSGSSLVPQRRIGTVYLP